MSATDKLAGYLALVLPVSVPDTLLAADTSPRETVALLHGPNVTPSTSETGSSTRVVVSEESMAAIGLPVDWLNFDDHFQRAQNFVNMVAARPEPIDEARLPVDRGVPEMQREETLIERP